MSQIHNESGNTDKPVLSLAAEKTTQKRLLDEVCSMLIRKLQTTLEAEQILDWFVSGVTSLVGKVNCRLTTNLESHEIAPLKRARHSLDYNLTIERQLLGNIEFTRNKRFSEDEMVMIETLLGCLVYPLRNSLHYQEAVNAAMSDALTGVANKRAFDYQIHREVALSQRYGSKLSLAIFDIDFFKKVNDTHGHAAGDAVLKQFVDVMCTNCRDSDLVFRLGGEEFAVLLTKTDVQGAYAIADRIREAIENTTFCYNGKRIPVTVSIGLATHQDFEGKMSFINRADDALYAAKSNGRNRTFLAEDFQQPNLATVESNTNNQRVG